MGNPKVNQVLGAVFTLLGAVFFFGAGLLLLILLEVKAPSVRTAPLFGRVSLSPLAAAPLAGALLVVAMALATVVMLEFGLYRLRRALVADARLLIGQEGFGRRKAVVNPYAYSIRTLAISIMLAGVDLLLIAYALLVGPPAPSLNLALFLAVLVVYLPLRKPAVRALAATEEALPSYTVTQDAVFLNLKHWRPRRGPGAGQPFRVGFDELNEVRALSLAEAEAFVLTEADRDPDLASREIKDLHAYQRGEIARPSAFSFGWDGVPGGPVLLRGPRLIYLIAFANPDTRDLVEAFAAYRHNPFPTRGVQG